MKILRRTVAAAVLATLVAALAACGANSDPLGQNTAQPSSSPSQDSGPIIVGSANFTESQVLAELYSQAMKAKGIESSTKLNIGSREVYLQALKDKSISAIPEYTGNLLLNFDKTSTASTAEEIEKALPEAIGSDYKVLKSSPAADQDVYVVARQFSEEKGVTSLADLSKVAPESILGGPSELKTRAYGPPGLKELYGAEFKEFRPYDAGAVKVKDLKDGKIQVATFFTTESAIADNHFVQLEDPKSMILPQNVIPLVRADVADNAEAVAAIEAVQTALTTEDLTQLNKKVDTDRLNPDEVAGEWLKAKGLA